ncbi:MAG: C39 family peptidase [Candidatus Woesearchaeota archaeon]
MIIDKVPYFSNRNGAYAGCQGPSTTMMVLRYFKPWLQIAMPVLYKQLGYSKEKWFFEVYIVELLDKYRLKAVYYSTKKIAIIGKNAKTLKTVSGLDFYDKKQSTAFDLRHYDHSVKYLLKKRLAISLHKISIAFIKKQLNSGKLCVATLNRGKILKEKKYIGHFTLIKGYNQAGFICNDSLFGEDYVIGYDLFRKSFYHLENKKKVNDLIVLG